MENILLRELPIAEFLYLEGECDEHVCKSDCIECQSELVYTVKQSNNSSMNNKSQFCLLSLMACNSYKLIWIEKVIFVM